MRNTSPNVGTPNSLELQNIALSFGTLEVMSNISFSVQKGDICSIIGPNGAGKSSLLNIINGVYPILRGKVLINEKYLPKPSPYSVARLGVSRTFQNNALFKNMSVADNILTGLTKHSESNFIEDTFRIGRARNEAICAKEKLFEILSYLKIENISKTRVGTLSYGFQKRVDLARALISKPSLLLLDEPLAGMNHIEKREMGELILDVNRSRGATIVLIEHDMGIVMDISDHIVVLNYGKKIADDEPRKIQSDPEVIAAYLGED